MSSDRHTFIAVNTPLYTPSGGMTILIFQHLIEGSFVKPHIKLVKKNENKSNKINSFLFLSLHRHRLTLLRRSFILLSAVFNTTLPLPTTFSSSPSDHPHGRRCHSHLRPLSSLQHVGDVMFPISDLRLPPYRRSKKIHVVGDLTSSSTRT